MPRKRVTTALVEKYLDRLGWTKHDTTDEPNEREGIVVTGWQASPFAEGHILVIDPMVERGYLAFRVRNLATAPTDATPSDRLRDLLLAIAALNYRLIMGCFAYDPTDGELSFKFAVPVAGDDLRFEDFERCIETITATVDGHASDLRDIIEGTKTARDVIG